MRDSSRQTLKIRAVSSLAVTGIAVICGRAEGQSGWRPINAISHIAWGRKGAQKNVLTARYTGMGLLLNGVASGFWTWSIGIVDVRCNPKIHSCYPSEAESPLRRWPMSRTIVSCPGVSRPALN
jgi:hypothetical protein